MNTLTIDIRRAEPGDAAAELVERFGHRSSGGLRGMKADAWEGGHRMPFLVRWPGVVEEGPVATTGRALGPSARDVVESRRPTPTAVRPTSANRSGAARLTRPPGGGPVRGPRRG